MSRFVGPDDYDYTQTPPPATTSDLLRLLGVERAPRSEQRVAVDGWLAENEPTGLLHAFLTRDGFIRVAADAS